MHWIKKILGWLCFLSLLAALGLGGYQVYTQCAPFSRGAALYTYDWSELDRQVAPGGITSSDGKLLKEYVAKGPKPIIRTGFDAGIDQMFTQCPVKKSVENPVIAAVLINKAGDVVAAEPADLAKILPRYKVDGDGSDWQWRSAIEDVISDRFDGNGIPEIYGMDNENGKRIGNVIIVPKEHYGSESVAVIPDSSQIVDKKTSISIIVAMAILLLSHFFLLPFWAGMDAGWRGMRPFAWGTLVFVTSWIGLFAYLIARLPAPRPCRNCGEPVLSKYKRCPACGASVFFRCPVCNTKMKPKWQFCPVCQDEKVEEVSGVRPTLVPQLPELPEAGHATLTVIVLDDDAGNPVSNARVVVRGATVLNGITNGSGVFEARNVEKGLYTVAATKRGYDADSMEIEVEENTCGDLVFRLKAQLGKVLGRVTDRSTQKSVANALVYLDTSRIDCSVRTDAGGGFTLSDIPAGPYTLCVESEGFAPQVKLVEVGPGHQIPIDFALDSEMRTAEINAPVLGRNTNDV